MFGKKNNVYIPDGLLKVVSSFGDTGEFIRNAIKLYLALKAGGCHQITATFDDGTKRTIQID